MKKTTRLMSLIIAAALILSGCNQNNVVSHGIPDTNGSDTTTTTTAITTSVTTTEATTTTSAAVSETEETTPATTVSIEETTVPVDAAVDVTEDTTLPAETTEITAEQAPAETTATTTSVAETTTVTTVSTTRATTTSTVILAYTSASVAGNPEPPHIYVIHVDKYGNEEYDWNSVWNDMGAGVFTQTIYAKELDEALENAFKYWEETYGNRYGKAIAKVIYYTGETIIYSRNGSTPATTTAATTASTTASTTKAQNTSATTSRTTATTTAAITTTTSSADTTVSVPKPETFADDYKNKYMYMVLNDAQKKYYEWWFIKGRYGIENGKRPNISSEDKSIASLALQISSLYTFDENALEIANSIVSKALKENTSYGQLKAIHDGLCDIAEYGGDQSMTKLFVNGKGTCFAYADAFTYLCQLAGFDCIRVSGDVYNGTNWGGHEWNMVKVDGKWYYVDVTWDDGGWGTKWFLKGTETMKKDHKVFTNIAVSSIYPIASVADYKA